MGRPFFHGMIELSHCFRIKYTLIILTVSMMVVPESADIYRKIHNNYSMWETPRKI